ncbi:hypothetical protein TeGR_g7998, partial [Tetraparma gracilis]
MPPLLQILVVLLPSLFLPRSTSTTIEIRMDSEDSPPIPLTCPPLHPAHSCAVTLCSEHNIGDTVEGLSCVEMLTDTIMAERANPSSSAPSSFTPDPHVFMDFANPDVPFHVPLSYPPSPPPHTAESFAAHNAPSITSFCSSYGLPPHACISLSSSLSALFSQYHLPPSRPFYFPVFVRDAITLDMVVEGEVAQLRFRAHQDAHALTTRFCLMLYPSIASCDQPALLDAIQTQAENFYERTQDLAWVPPLKFHGPIAVNALSTPGFPLLIFGEEQDRPSVPLATSAVQYCATVRCPDRINTVNAILQSTADVSEGGGGGTTRFDRSLVADPALDFRVIVSLSSLPSRLAHLPDVLSLMLKQTVLPDEIYVNIPDFSAREQLPYVLPERLVGWLDGLPEAERGLIKLNWCRTDFGPATKLISTLLAETIPSTLIVTIDDDLDYPPYFLARVVQNARRYTNSAFGFKGYRLGEGGGHSNFTYYESLDLQADVSVDVLGGFVGVAYRSGFFSLARLMDYASYPAGAFFVDDDWIGSVLADAGVERVVLSAENGGEVSRYLFEEEVITPVAHIRSLNGKHGF